MFKIIFLSLPLFFNLLNFYTFFQFVSDHDCVWTTWTMNEVMMWETFHLRKWRQIHLFHSHSHLLNPYLKSRLHPKHQQVSICKYYHKKNQGLNNIKLQFFWKKILPKLKQDIDNKLVLLFIMDFQPFSIVEDFAFRHLLPV